MYLYGWIMYTRTNGKLHWYACGVICFLRFSLKQHPFWPTGSFSLNQAEWLCFAFFFFIRRMDQRYSRLDDREQYVISPYPKLAAFFFSPFPFLQLTQLITLVHSAQAAVGFSLFFTLDGSVFFPPSGIPQCQAPNYSPSPCRSCTSAVGCPCPLSLS